LVQVSDPFELQCFVDAQEPVFELVLAELRGGRKRTQWMWFIFPQIAGVASSDIPQRFAIRSLAEAMAYLDHPVLGSRLRECSRLICNIEKRSIADVLGYHECRQLHSSVTLFSIAAPTKGTFTEVLRKYFGSEYEKETIDRIM
jgi:uncharacterized protein (DUF1810 family)